MQYVHDLTGKLFDEFDFCEAHLGFRVPERLPPKAELYVWGAVFHPRYDPVPPEIVPSHAAPLDPLYVAGEATLTLNGVVGGSIAVSVYEPSFERPAPGFLIVDGEQVRLHREWKCPSAHSCYEYEFNSVLINPHGYCILKLLASGEASLQFDTRDVVTLGDLMAAPEKYGWGRATLL